MKPTTSLDNDNDREYAQALLEHAEHNTEISDKATHVVKVWKQATVKNKYYEGEAMTLVTQIAFTDKPEALKYFESVQKHLADYNELYKIKGSQLGPGWVQHRATLCTE